MQDRSFTFILKTPPASDLLKKAAKVRVLLPLSSMLQLSCTTDHLLQLLRMQNGLQICVVRAL